VRAQSLTRLLFTLLAFQLALGMQVGVAYGSTPTHQGSAVHESSATAACATHTALSRTSSHAKAPLEKSTDRHDCCKSSGCQCQCGNAPLAFNVTAVRGVSATASVQPIRAIGPVVAPTDTHFRPPIAS